MCVCHRVREYACVCVRACLWVARWTPVRALESSRGPVLTLSAEFRSSPFSGSQQRKQPPEQRGEDLFLSNTFVSLPPSLLLVFHFQSMELTAFVTLFLSFFLIHTVTLTFPLRA